MCIMEDCFELGLFKSITVHLVLFKFIVINIINIINITTSTVTTLYMKLLCKRREELVDKQLTRHKRRTRDK